MKNNIQNINQKNLNNTLNHNKNKINKKNIKEIGGRKGLDPVRYNDWEVKGIAVDF